MVSRLKRTTFLALLVIVVVAGCGPHPPGKSATLESAVDYLFPPRVFGHVKDAQCATDPPGDFGFATGGAPGRHDPWVDIRRACGATLNATPAIINQIEAGIPCGPTSDGGLVVCSSPHSSLPPPNNVLTPGELVVFAFQVKGDIPLQAPLEETGRVSVFIDAGGDRKTKSQKTAEAPDSASQGTNVTYQVIFNDPGTDVVDVGNLSVDRRKRDEFFQTSGRAWIRANIVTFVIPKSEIGDDVKGLRGATFWGSRSAQGDASKGNQKVVPGGAHVRGLIRYSG
jgi:hypothetical protein